MRLYYDYTNIRGLPIAPERVVACLERIEKDELECKNFFGEQVWLTPGFAYYWLEMTAAQKEWCMELARRAP